MPEDSKKSQHKGKHEAKEQRKPRHQRQHAAEKSERIEKKVEEPKAPPKPVLEEPGPEFYKNLKRETDEILKITEEANAKYKKKEIESNWSKYEMPIESYEEIEDSEQLGADYEKLIQASATTGGHFQFKHEKSWDINTGPSLYDKYFEIDMDNLATAISTIPFFERNSMDFKIFSQTDITCMNSRAVKYRRKYYNDKSYTTPELEAQDTILNSINDGIRKPDDISEQNERTGNIEEHSPSVSGDINLLASDAINTEPVKKVEEINIETKVTTETNTKLDSQLKESNAEITRKTELFLDIPTEPTKAVDKEIDDLDDILLGDTESKINTRIPEDTGKSIEVTSHDVPPASTKVADNPPKETKKAAMESPEDLEKWLDDFLDG